MKSKRPPPTAKPIGKGGGLRPPPFPVGFAVGGGRLDPQNRRFPARPAPGDKDKSWSSHGRGRLGSVWCPKGSKPVPNRAQTIPTGPRTTSIVATRVATTSIDRRMDFADWPSKKVVHKVLTLGYAIELPGRKSSIFGGLNGAKPTGKGGGRSPPTFSNGFCGRRGPFRPPK